MGTLLVIIFLVGYLFIVFESGIRLNKAATALITAGVLWTVLITQSSDFILINKYLQDHLVQIAEILFFLLGAMTIVELIDAHNGFDLVTDRIKHTDKRKLIWVLSFVAFFLSAVLDNLTTAIVMVSVLRKLIEDKKDRLFFAGMIIIAANAGGAWSPIGDVTTTMLWIKGQISGTGIILRLFLPSLVCMVTPLLILSFILKGKVQKPAHDASHPMPVVSKKLQRIVLYSGLLILLLVPVFKASTHLPPYISILLGLGLLWIITEILHSGKEEQDKTPLSVAQALRKIDTPTILFFFGILMAVGALEAAGLLGTFGNWLADSVSDVHQVPFLLGIISAIVDNVPLVAASQGMYSTELYPKDHSFWMFLAYCTGTGGSMLIIGSAAGVAAMGIEKINFFWYLKRISLLAFLGYIAGAGVFMLQQMLG